MLKFPKKSIKIIIALLYLLFISSCTSTAKNIDPNILTTAWQNCKAATGQPTGKKFNGKAVLVWNLHPKMDYYEETSIIYIEQVGNKRIIDSPFFILGDYDYSDSYNFEDIFTRRLEEAGAFLCISINYWDIEICEYGPNSEKPAFTIIRTIPEASVKLVRRSDNIVLAEQNVTAPTPNGCPQVFYGSDKFSTDHMVEMSNIDIFRWFLNYKQ